MWILKKKCAWTICMHIGAITTGAIQWASPGSDAQSCSKEGIKITSSGSSQLHPPCCMLAPGRPWASDLTSAVLFSHC